MKAPDVRTQVYCRSANWKRVAADNWFGVIVLLLKLMGKFIGKQKRLSYLPMVGDDIKKNIFKQKYEWNA